VLNEMVVTAERDGLIFQAIRCPLLGDEPASPGSAILKESHIQIAVRVPGCTLGVFRPRLTWSRRGAPP
jgi:hypothetical protein